MWDYVGLLCLLVGIGAFFALWMMTIGNRSKQHMESDTVPADPQSAPEHLMRQMGYSLSPEQKRHAPDTTGPAASTTVSDQAPQSDREAAIHQPVAQAVEAQDETATNHLEMANLFFNIGDFEGVMEMCQLILENASASQQQIEKAQDLKARCS